MVAAGKIAKYGSRHARKTESKYQIWDIIPPGW